MSAARTSIAALAAAACVALGFGLVVAPMRAQDARIDALLRELSASRAQQERATVDTETSRSPVVVRSGGLDARDLDAIAARIVALDHAEAKTDALVAAEAKAPTPAQLAARSDVQHQVDAMIARGHARREDVHAIGSEMESDPEGRTELARQLAVAINTGKLVPDDPPAMHP
jgi:hypothetical protein